MSAKYELQDTAEPNTLDDMFDYSLPPKIQFDGPLVEEIDGKQVIFDPKEALTRDLVITDTTFRDGQQARPPYTVEQQVKWTAAPPPTGRPVRLRFLLNNARLYSFWCR